MKYKVIRSYMHIETAEVEADSREEALRLAHQDLDDEDWETDDCGEIDYEIIEEDY